MPPGPEGDALSLMNRLRRMEGPTNVEYTSTGPSGTAIDFDLRFPDGSLVDISQYRQMVGSSSVVLGPRWTVWDFTIRYPPLPGSSHNRTSIREFMVRMASQYTDTSHLDVWVNPGQTENLGSPGGVSAWWPHIQHQPTGPGEMDAGEFGDFLYGTYEDYHDKYHPSGSQYDAPPEYDDGVRQMIDLVNDFGDVYNVTSHTVRTSIDFATGEDHDRSLLERASGGTYGSSVVVDTRNDRVSAATLRFGSLNLPDAADEHAAAAKLDAVVEGTNPPPGVDTRLRQMGGDIIHVLVEEPVDLDIFEAWYRRLDPTIREAEGEIRDLAISVAY